MDPHPIAFREADHTYWDGNIRVPNVTTIMTPVVDYSMVREEVLARKSAIGRAVHTACEYYDQDDLDWDSLPDEIIPYVEAWAEFSEKSNIKVEYVEQRVFHSRLRYAGTLDVIGNVNGESWLIDRKTTCVLSPSVGIQTAAYQQALLSQSGTLVHRRFAVQLKKDGKYCVKEYSDPDDWPVFVSLLTLYNWNQKHAKP